MKDLVREADEGDVQGRLQQQRRVQGLQVQEAPVAHHCPRYEPVLLVLRQQPLRRRTVAERLRNAYMYRWAMLSLTSP